MPKNEILGDPLVQMLANVRASKVKPSGNTGMTTSFVKTSTFMKEKINAEKRVVL
jgi:hypothetical protein